MVLCSPIWMDGDVSKFITYMRKLWKYYIWIMVRLKWSIRMYEIEILQFSVFETNKNYEYKKEVLWDERSYVTFHFVCVYCQNLSFVFVFVRCLFFHMSKNMNGVIGTFILMWYIGENLKIFGFICKYNMIYLINFSKFNYRK